MPSGDAEVGRMVAVFELDNANFRREYASTLREIESSGQQIAGAIKPAEQATQKLGLGFRDARHGIHLLGAATGLQGITGQAMMGVYAYRILGHTISAVTAQIGVMGVVAAGTGLGLAIAGIAVLVNEYQKLQEHIEKAAEVAGSMFKEMAAGKTEARAAAQAMIEHLEKELGEALKKRLNPGFWQSFKDSFRVQLHGGDLTKMRDEDLAETINRTIEDEINGRKQINALLERSVAFQEALRDLQNQKKNEADIEDDKKMANQEQEIRNRTALLGLSGRDKSLLENQQKYMMSHPDIMSPADARRATFGQRQAINAGEFDKMLESIYEDAEKAAVELEKVGKTQEDAFAIDMVEKFRKALGDLSDEETAARDGLIEFRQQQMYLKESADWAEKTKLPMEKYIEQMQHLDEVAVRTGMSQETYMRAVQKLQKDILGPDKGPINFHAAAAGSAESITRIQQQGDKSRDTLQVLHDILDVLKGQNAGPQVNLVPAGFGG